LRDELEYEADDVDDIENTKEMQNQIVEDELFDEYHSILLR